MTADQTGRARRGGPHVHRGIELKQYEFLYILDPQEETTKKTIEDVKERYKQIGARVLKEEEMGKRRLTFEIRKRTDGFYYLTQIEIDDVSKLREFERELKLNPNIIRFMKVRA
jgi:small subunit ribosomal protein S6